MQLFSCTMDELIREDMTACSEAYSEIRHREDASVNPCFEKEYKADGMDYMDVYIAIDD